MTQEDIRSFGLAEIAHRCAQETERFFQRRLSDPRYCFELFRRAIADRNARAWQLLYTQYRPLVGGWIQRHPAFSSCTDEPAYYVNVAFEKMWAAVPAGRFEQFATLRALLRYLQMCAHSAVLEEVRRTQAPAADFEPELAADPGPGAETPTLEPMDRQVLWRQVSDRLKDDKERKVVYGCFVLALKPRDLCAQFPGTFSGVGEVYRVKENVLDRLRRDPVLQAYWQS